MSHTVLTAVYGATDRNGCHPRSIRVVADLVVGGSGVLVVHSLESAARIRIRPDSLPLADVLIAGFALIGEVPLAEEPAAVATRIAREGEVIELTLAEGAILKRSVAGTDVTLVVTSLSWPREIEPEDFKGTNWAVFLADASEVTGRGAPNWRGL